MKSALVRAKHPAGAELLTAAGTVLVGAALYFSGTTAYAFFYVWIALYAAYYLSPARAGLQIGLILCSYPVAEHLGRGAGPSPLRWLSASATLAVAAGTVVLLKRNLAATANRIEALAEALVADTSGRKHLESRLAQRSKMEALGRLAGGIAHDFNNLLLVIRSHAWLLGERSGRTPEIAAIENAAEDAGRIVAQLLAFGRRQEALEPEILDVNEVLAQVESLLGPVIGEDIELVRSVSDATATVLADRTQLELIVVNLALNARDALPGGGKLEMAAEPAVHDGARWVRLRVSDTGVGIEPDVQARIFEPFFTTKEGGRGTGLGLSVVHELVAQNGGEIEVSSTPGRGTTFSVYLPYVGAPVSAPPREEPPAEPRATRGMETVLVADDEADVRDSLQGTLERYGYRVITAADADAALAIADELRSEIDVVVTDVVMPSMSGFELARRLTSIAPDLPVVYISGYPDEAIVEAPLPGPVFLPKPFTPPLLARTIREALGSVRVPCA